MRKVYELWSYTKFTQGKKRKCGEGFQKLQYSSEHSCNWVFFSLIQKSIFRIQLPRNSYTQRAQKHMFVRNTNKESSITLTNVIIINTSNFHSPCTLLFHIRAAFSINKRQLFILFRLPSFSSCRHELYIKLFKPLTIFITPLNGRKDSGNNFSQLFS